MTQATSNKWESLRLNYSFLGCPRSIQPLQQSSKKQTWKGGRTILIIFPHPGNSDPLLINTLLVNGRAGSWGRLFRKTTTEIKSFDLLGRDGHLGMRKEIRFSGMLCSSQANTPVMPHTVAWDLFLCYSFSPPSVALTMVPFY